MSKHIRYQLVKTNRSYTVDDVSRLLFVSKGTVRRWVKNGLHVMQEKKPILIKGSILKQYLQTKSKPKQKCALDECRCFKCNSNQKVAFKEAEIIFDNSPTPNMRGLCNTCSTIMHKRISKTKIPDIKAILQITFRQADETISIREQPRSNEHL